MLESLRIKNFRIFRDLQLSRLGRVNLLVGKNNSGKTCLLEALRVYGTSGEPDVLREMIRTRNEDAEELYDELAESPDVDSTGFDLREFLSDPVRNLFHGHRLPSDPEQAIEIGPVQGGTYLRLLPRAFQRVVGDDGSARQSPLNISSWDELANKAADVDSRIEMYIALEEIGSDGERQKMVLMDFPFEPRVLRLRPTIEPRMDVRFVPVRYMNEREIGDLWDRVVVRPRRRQHVVEVLRLIDPNIQEVVLLRSHGRGAPVPVLLYADETRLPLMSLGDGMLHLFHLALAAVSAKKGGMVLFDEVENGLHWSVQPLLWRMLFDLSLALDIQIVATTHSWDCVHGFKEVAAEHDAEAMLFHLGRSVRKSREGEIMVIEYDKEHLERATRAGLEVR